MADSKPAAYSAPAARALVSPIADRVRPNAKLIALLSLGHLVVDLNQGSLPAFLPVLKAAHQLSYASAATIVLAANDGAALDAAGLGAPDRRGVRADGPGARLHGADRAGGRDGARRRRLPPGSVQGGNQRGR